MNNTIKSFQRHSLNSTTFGVGRESFARVVSANKFNYLPYEPSEPGPGAYTPKLIKNKSRYSMRPKTAVDSKFSRFILIYFNSSLNSTLSWSCCLLKFESLYWEQI